jgi:hypothetical protein
VVQAARLDLDEPLLQLVGKFRCDRVGLMRSHVTPTQEAVPALPTRVVAEC